MPIGRGRIFCLLTFGLAEQRRLLDQSGGVADPPGQWRRRAQGGWARVAMATRQQWCREEGVGDGGGRQSDLKNSIQAARRDYSQ